MLWRCFFAAYWGMGTNANIYTEKGNYRKRGYLRGLLNYYLFDPTGLLLYYDYNNVVYYDIPRI